jgi:hypothetical protein
MTSRLAMLLIICPTSHFVNVPRSIITYVAFNAAMSQRRARTPHFKCRRSPCGPASKNSSRGEATSCYARVIQVGGFGRADLVAGCRLIPSHHESVLETGA